MTITTNEHEVTHFQLEGITQLIDPNSVSQDGLFNGNMGKAFYYLYLYKFTQNEKYKVAGHAILAGVFERLNNRTSKVTKKISLVSGLAGLGWALTTLSDDHLLEYNIQEFLETIDQTICRAIPTHIQNNSLDFLHSSIGALAYLADRRDKNPLLEPHLEAFVEQLQQKMVAHKDGGSYIQNQYYYNLTKIGYPEDVNLRLAHGYCGILLVLIQLYQKGIARQCLRHMIEEGVAFILNTMQEANLEDIKKYAFPSNILVSYPKDHEQNRLFYNLRLGWCYGDLNQVLLLYKAGNLFNRQDWITIADQVGAFCLRKKDPENTLISDVCFCHGTAGNARFYRAIYHASGNAMYLTGYEYWMEKTTVWIDETLKGQTTFPNPPHYFLEGLLGTGLALMSHQDEQYSSWEKFVLLN